MPTADSYAEDDAEVVKAQWLNPFQALNLHYSGRDGLFQLVVVGGEIIMGDSDVHNPWDKSEEIRKETVTFSPGLVFYPPRGRPRRIHNTYPLPPLSLRMDGPASDLRTSASRSTVRFRSHQSVLCVSARIRSHALVARRRQRRRWSGQRPSRRQSLPDRLVARRGGEVFTFAT